ncbi:MAG: protein kinase [Candidatus Acidiferrales bacterium]
MTLATGTKIGAYEILAAIGAGGMGEVYRARDAKLGRDVALKVLPEAFARDSERMARFQREAKLLASLNHPNIAAIYGFEDSGLTHALVMELVEGPTLADRIASAPIPIDEALRIARQICEALEYAHERGIVHRDLKPANIKISRDDSVKILDFGLAKAIEGDASSLNMSNSPTLTRMATMQGVLLGTAAYMSPEQAKGRPVDRRADIWAFGCVLYEMLTGKMAFTGETVTDTLAAVIRAEPDWSQLPAATPARVRVLLQRCLQKDAKQRLQAIGDARISLEDALSGAPEPTSAGAAPVAAPPWRRALPWAVAACLAVALAALGWAYAHNVSAPAPAELTRFEIPVPRKVTLASDDAFALSPDGRQLAFFSTGADGVQRIWVRPLDSLQARSLPGSESTAAAPWLFWSPDSRRIAFSTAGKLKTIDVSSGTTETLCDTPALVFGGSWNRAGVIIFGQYGGGLMRISANGGPASQLTAPDPSRDVDFYPSFLPDGRHFIYLRASTNPAHSGVYIGSLDAKPAAQSSKRLVATAYGPVYVPFSAPGFGQLLFLTSDGTLMAQPFDARRLELTGEPVPVAEQIGSLLSYGYFSASTNGVLVYKTGVGGVSRLTWFDRQGKNLGTAGEPGAYDTISLSPDGTRAIVSRADDPSHMNVETLWLVDFARGTSTRFTFGSSSATLGIWSPHGNRIIFASNRSGRLDLYQKLASGVTGAEVLLKSSDDKWPTSWSRDGHFLLYQLSNGKASRKPDLWVLPLEGDKKPFLFESTGSDSDDGQFSPDGHLIAYLSNESGRDDIYVRTFSPATTATTANTGGKWLISTAGGTEPRWRGDGKELYYLAPDDMLMAVDISENPVFSAGVPKPLFQAPQHLLWVSENHWDVTRDGKRFLFAAQSTEAPFTVVLNWQAALKQSQ